MFTSKVAGRDIGPKTKKRRKTSGYRSKIHLNSHYDKQKHIPGKLYRKMSMDRQNISKIS